MSYGPLFTNVIEAAAAPGQHTGHAVITIPDTKSSMPHQFEYPHLIHPATLDAIFHLIFVAYAEGNRMAEAAIPVSMGKMYIAANQPQGPGAMFVGFSHAVKSSDREAAGDLVVSDESWSETKIEVRDLAVRQVSSGGSDAMQSASAMLASPKRVAQLEWKADIDTLTGDAATELLRKSPPTGIHPALDVKLSSRLNLWLELACHKHADLRVLALGARSHPWLLDTLRQFAPRSGRRMTFQECTLLDSFEDDVNTIKQELVSDNLSIRFESLTLPSATPSQIEDLGTYDLFIIGLEGASLELQNYSRPKHPLSFHGPRKNSQTSRHSSPMQNICYGSREEMHQWTKKRCNLVPRQVCSARYALKCLRSFCHILLSIQRRNWPLRRRHPL